MININTRVEDRSPELITRCSDAGVKAYKKCGAKMVKIVRNNIAYRTGLLKASIGQKVKIMDGLPILDVGAKKKARGTRAYHAHLVEKGTATRRKKSGKPTGSASAQPFLANKQSELQSILEQGLREEMSKIGDN